MNARTIRRRAKTLLLEHHNDDDPPAWRALLDLVADGEDWACQSTPMVDMLEALLVGLAIVADQNHVRRPFLELLSNHSVRLLRGDNPADYAVREIGRIEG